MIFMVVAFLPIGAEEAVDLTAFVVTLQIGNRRMLAVTLAQGVQFRQRNTPSFFSDAPIVDAQLKSNLKIHFLRFLVVLSPPRMMEPA